MANIVTPIKDLDVFDKMLRYFKDKEDISTPANRDIAKRNRFMFEIGSFLGLRISDLRELRVKDVLGKDSVTLKMKKTSNNIRLDVSAEDLQKRIEMYVKSNRLKPNDYLFTSRQKACSCKANDKKYCECPKKPISRQMAWNVINEAAQAVGYNQPVGTHTLRKTFGYRLYKESNDIGVVMVMLGQRSPEVTLRYIGIDEDRVKIEMKKLASKYISGDDY